MSDERGSERVGRTIREKYTIDRVLGVGGMAVVYVATHRNRKRFAIKMLHPELSSRKDIRDRFVREGYVANTVDHPGAVAVVDDDVAEDGAAFLVMELLEGVELESLWERSGHFLPLEVVLACADGLLDVLVAAHAKGIVHRDLKPANLFVTKLGQVKVLDFGIARLREGDGQAQTQTGAMMGTPAFLPPEQAAGRTKEIDGQTDLWAVGATVFTLLTGQFVHAAENGAQMVIMSATQPARSLRTTAPQAPPWLVAWVDRALALHKQERWPDAATMLAELRRNATPYFAARSMQAVLADAVGTRPSAPVASSPYAATVLPAGSATPGPVMATPPPGSFGSGGTTAQPVSMTGSPAPVDGPPMKRTPVVPIVAAVVGAGALIAGAVVFASGAFRTTTAAATGEPSSTVPATTRVGATSDTPLATLSPAATTTATAKPRPSTSASASATATASIATNAPPPSATAKPTVTAAKANCDPPYVIDGQGNRHFKPECF